MLDAPFTKDEVLFQLKRSRMPYQNWIALDSKAEVLVQILNLCRKSLIKLESTSYRPCCPQKNGPRTWATLWLRRHSGSPEEQPPHISTHWRAGSLGLPNIEDELDVARASQAFRYLISKDKLVVARNTWRSTKEQARSCGN